MVKEDKECLNLEQLKEKYDKFKDKYKLPEFFELNEIFEIEEVDAETDFLLRKIRRAITERIAGYMRFFEIILNPSNAPMFFFKLIKKLDSKDKEILGEIYDKLGYLEIELVKMDIDYKEEAEAEFIRKVFMIFTNMKKNILNVLNKFGTESEEKKRENGSYFG